MQPGRQQSSGEVGWPAAWGPPHHACKCVKLAAQDFTQQSTLHGLRYITDRSISSLERWFWLVSCLAAGVFAVYFIQNVYHEWVSSPVIMTLSPQTTQLEDIPFPAVTICNVNLVRKSVALDILKRAKSGSAGNGSLEHNLLNDYCHHPQHPLDEDDDVDEEEERPWEEVRKFMLKGCGLQVSQDCSKMVVACFWHGEKFDCNKLFVSSLTDWGFCCSFNVVRKEFVFNEVGNWAGVNQTVPFKTLDWTMEGGYPEGTPPFTLPWRPWGPGSHMGLRVALDAEPDEYYCSTDVSMGLKVAVHNPNETPKMRAYAATVQPGQETRVVVEPMIWTSSREQLQLVPPSRRNCYFRHEKNLTFYHTYSQRNCMLECEANFTLMACGCVLFYMSSHNSGRVCGRNESHCALKALTAMEVRLVDDGDMFASLSSVNSSKACGCKPGCFAISYKQRLSTTQLIDKASFIPKELLGGNDIAYFSKNMAIMNVYFTESHFTSNYRTVLYSFSDFLANTGGLLGLFMGFSFLSAVEGFYFLTLRLWCFLIRNRHNLQTSSSS